MTRPMTGQPATTEELTNAVQRANESMNEDDNLEELRNFREQTRELGNDEIGAYGEPQTDDETEMVVEENDETTTYTRDEWENERGARTRTWDRLERNGGSFVRVAHWFRDPDMNKVSSGRGFYGHKIGETEKALQFEVPPTANNHNAEEETVWIPKKAARVHTLE